MKRSDALAFLDRITEGVTAIVYRDETDVGSFGEPRVVVVGDGDFMSSASLA